MSVLLGRVRRLADRTAGSCAGFTAARGEEAAAPGESDITPPGGLKITSTRISAEAVYRALDHHHMSLISHMREGGGNDSVSHKFEGKLFAPESSCEHTSNNHWFHNFAKFA